jgi:hypothetical protein
MTPLPAQPARASRLAQAGLIAGSILLALLVGAVGLGVWALREGRLHPPPFEVKLGRVELSAPCPMQGFDCDPTLPYYAIWRGDGQPDGSIRYRLLYFTYLKHPDPR